MRTLFGRRRYDELIEKATLALAEPGQSATDLLYWRGYAKRRIGWLDEAAQDLEGLGDFIGWPAPEFPAASKLASEVEAMRKLRPILKKEIRRGNNILFRVYYSEDNAFTRTIIDALPEGYTAATTFFGFEVHEIPIFIFNETEYERFFKFYSLLGRTPHNWWRILSNSASIVISQRNGKGEVLAPDVAFIPRHIAHELTHVFMFRRLGLVAGFPNWFNEGSAQLTETAVEPGMTRRNDARMQTLLRQGAILPLELLTSSAAFHEAVDQLNEGQQKADPYAQGLSMTRHLISQLKTATLVDFWALMQEKRNFEAALKQGTGLTTPEFYNSWLRSIEAAKPD